ncbi:MAG TPA: hydroxyethylthiazole kinase [Candidatus Omnitrophota bacterium]|nr:hydroxyethylthiazole kinase [Candidatus Omnitrophota bacterium]HPT07102.1 hydroxyethylthiazole kinase [Candidatus Omnitrophota bacterium]
MVNIQAEPFLLCERVRLQKPVVHHLTNWVTIYDCAQVVKTLGASPVMAHAPEEVEEMARLASALVLNIGTLTVDFVASMKKAAYQANKKGIPVVLDVCGAGATSLRDKKCNELLTNVRIDIIKGNVSEIARIAGFKVHTKGVDAAEVLADVDELAVKLAKRQKAVVVVTGKIDSITDGQMIYRVANGNAMMTRVVGTGCMATSVIGTFAAVEKNLILAAASALAVFGIAAECAAPLSKGPATFKEKLFDCLYSLDIKTIKRLQKISCCAV